MPKKQQEGYFFTEVHDGAFTGQILSRKTRGPFDGTRAVRRSRSMRRCNFSAISRSNVKDGSGEMQRATAHVIWLRGKT